jgi:hypothetical protein
MNNRKKFCSTSPGKMSMRRGERREERGERREERGERREEKILQTNLDDLTSQAQ